MSANRTPGLHVLGTGTFAAEIAEIARDAAFDVVALVELRDDSRVGGRVHGLPVVAFGEPPDASARAVIGTGAGRTALAERLARLGWTPATVIHPTAHVSPSASIGAGTVVAPRAVVGAAATVGANAILARGVLVGHHTTIGDGVTLNPGANVAGNCAVAGGAFVGMGAIVLDHVRIGRDAVVGAGAVVTRDVAPGQRVQGVPARPYPPPRA